MRIEETVSYVLSRVTTTHRTAVERSMGLIGLHSGQVSVLLELWKRDGQRQVDLARQLGVTTPTVNKIINGMIEARLVSRARLENDARSTRIFLTRTGSAVRESVEQQWHELEVETVAGLTDAERLIFFELLTKMKNIYTGVEEE